MKIAATLTFCEQVGADSYRDNHVTKAFSLEDSFFDVFQWASSIGVKEPKLGDFLFSEILD